MNKIIFAFFYLLIFFIGNTQIVSEATMRDVGLNYYNYISTNKFVSNDIKIQKNSYYNNTLTFSTIVFNNNDWIIVSSDKGANPILAYSTEHSYSNTIPPNVSFWLEKYDLYVYGIRNGTYIAEEDINYTDIWDDIINNDLGKYSQRAVVVAPLISTKWGQKESNDGNDNNAYNYYAPVCNSNDNDLAGCPAIAAGQIIKYWQYPDCNLFDWTNMPDELNINDNNYLVYKKEIANFIRNVGDKMQAQMSSTYWGCTASGTNTTNEILNAINYGFLYSNAFILNRSDYNQSGWEDILCESLNWNRPILYTGTNSSSGHAFVCDGYELDNSNTKKFHFNFGWNGGYDGYYTAANPMDHSNNQEAIFNIYNPCTNSLTIYQTYETQNPSYYFHPIAGNIYTSVTNFPVHLSQSDNVHYEAYNQIVIENFDSDLGADFVGEIISCPQPACNFTNYKMTNKSLDVSKNQQYINNQINLISVYPNPSENIFNIHINCKNVSGKIFLYDNLGKKLLKKELSKNDIVLDLSGYYSGIYVIKFISNDYTATQKIIKQ